MNGIGYHKDLGLFFVREIALHLVGDVFCKTLVQHDAENGQDYSDRRKVKKGQAKAGPKEQVIS
jgi:hypothetical protein